MIALIIALIIFAALGCIILWDDAKTIINCIDNILRKYETMKLFFRNKPYPEKIINNDDNIFNKVKENIKDLEIELNTKTPITKEQQMELDQAKLIESRKEALKSGQKKIDTLLENITGLKEVTFNICIKVGVLEKQKEELIKTAKQFKEENKPDEAKKCLSQANVLTTEITEYKNQISMNEKMDEELENKILEFKTKLDIASNKLNRNIIQLEMSKIRTDMAKGLIGVMGESVFSGLDGLDTAVSNSDSEATAFEDIEQMLNGKSDLIHIYDQDVIDLDKQFAEL